MCCSGSTIRCANSAPATEHAPIRLEQTDNRESEKPALVQFDGVAVVQMRMASPPRSGVVIEFDSAEDSWAISVSAKFHLPVVLRCSSGLGCHFLLTPDQRETQRGHCGPARARPRHATDPPSPTTPKRSAVELPILSGDGTPSPGNCLDLPRASPLMKSSELVVPPNSEHEGIAHRRG